MEPQTQPINPTNDAGTSCVICFDTISLEHKAIIKNCSHVFCFPCIKSWMHTTITCPLCKQTMDVLQHSFTSETSFQEEKVEAPNLTPQEQGGGGGGGAEDVASSLSCLDHSFFIVEVQRLLSDAEMRHRQLRQSSVSVRGLSLWDQQQLEVVETITSELHNYKRRLNALLQFDPHATIQDLYRLQDLLQTTWRVPVSSYATSRARSPPRRYSADDADAANDLSDDEDYVEDMSYLKIGKGANGKKGGQQRQSKSKYRTPAEKIGNSKNRKGISN